MTSQDLQILLQDNSVDRYLGDLRNEDLLVYSPVSLLHTKGTLNPDVALLNSETIGIVKENLDKYLESHGVFPKKVTGCGGGKTLDIAKYLAAKSKATLVLIPGILSTNAFSTDKVVLKESGECHTYPGKLADSIIIDKTFLLASEFRWNLYGLADVLSFHTALKDWEIAVVAGKSQMSFGIYHFGTLLLDTLLSKTRTITKPTKENVELIVRLVALSGHLTNLYGNGRPESGSEHIFARGLEVIIDIPHSIATGLGIAIMSELQNNYSSKIVHAIRHLQLFDRIDEYNVSEKMLLDVLTNIRPRTDRYTIINETSLSKSRAKHIIGSIQKKYSIQLCI